MEHAQREDRAQVSTRSTKPVSPALPNGRNRLRPRSGQFYLLTGKVAPVTQFGTQNNQLLHKYDDEPRLWMNAKTAAAQGLRDNDLVEVTSDVGKIHVKLHGHAGHPPGLCLYDAGYGHLSKGLTTAYGLGASDFGPARHLYRPDQRRPGAQPDLCNGKEGLRWERS